MQVRKINAVLIALLLSFAACQENPGHKEELIGPNKSFDPKGLLTPEALWSFGRLGEVSVSPDNNFIAYTVTWYSIDKNKGNTELFVMSADGSNKSQLTFTNAHEFNPLWVNEKTIAFLSTEGGISQIWTIDRDGSNMKKVEGFSEDINGFKLSPNGEKLLFIAEVKVGNDVADIYPDLPKTSGMIINDLMYRHWDTWEDSLFSHVFIADFSMAKIENIKDIMPNEPYDAPLKPFGGMEEISWNSDGTAVAYTCKKLVGKEYSFSTDSDIFLYNLNSGETKNLTQGMVGYDKQPVFSPDGKKMTWISMERPGFEADKERLFMLDFETGEKVYLTKGFDYSASNVMWTPDSKSVYFISGVEATYQIYRMDIADQNPVAITRGLHDYHSIAFLGENLVGSKVSITKPAEIYSIDKKSGDEVELSFINKDLLAKIEMPKVDRRWVKSTDGKLVHTWVILPPNFDSTKKYPALLYCEGGPQSAVSQFWSYRWNFSIMASNGYVVVAPSRRGTLTFGQAWTDEISKDHGGQEMNDLLAAIDEVKKEPWVDENKLGAIGASYGGYTVFWLAGNHNKRFKAFIAHCGVFHSEMEYLTTEEMFFDNWEMGGAPWDTDNKVAMKSFSHSPHLFVKKWDTPILVIHGGKDFRIPYTQGMAAFNTARMMGIPSRFLFFPDENHWVLKPQNGILWQREFKGWLDKWLK